MATPNWKLINYNLASFGLSLEITGQSLQITDSNTGKSMAFPWVYFRRCEPSVLLKSSAPSKDRLLIADRVPLKAARRLCELFRGYIDLLGNFDFFLGKKRYSHRVTRTVLRQEKKVPDFFAPSSYVGGKVFRALLQAENPVSMRDLSSKTGLSLGAVSEACQYARKALSLNAQKDLWSNENKARLLDAWKKRYASHEEQRFLCFADQTLLVEAIESGALPFLLIGGDYARKHHGEAVSRPTLTLCATSHLPEDFLARFGLIPEPNGNIVIRKASAFAIREGQEAYVDEIEAYLTSGLPESPNSDQ